jgi:hypothetical protein
VRLHDLKLVLFSYHLLEVLLQASFCRKLII